MLKKIKTLIPIRVIELDHRSLALSRILLGLLIALDAIFRLGNFRAHYTDFGVLPLEALFKLAKPAGLCIHCHAHSDEGVVFLFLLQIIFGILLSIGWKTRFSLLASWLLTVSLHFRNPLIIDGGDVLLRSFLFWLYFTPLNQHFSVDARKLKERSHRSRRIIYFALPIQLFLMYFMSALLKTGADWWPLGTATGYALSLEAFVTPLGKWLTLFPEALKHMTRAVYILELWGPFLLLMWGYYRLAGVILFIFFHFSLGLALDLALFPWIAYGCLISLLPSEFWNFFKRFKVENHHPSEFQHSSSIKHHFETALVSLLLLTVIAWNISDYIKKPIPKPIRKVVRALHIDQYWGMFAPYPLKDSGWFEFGLLLKNGEYVYAFVHDTMEEQWDMETKKPKYGALYFVDQRWRKYLVNIWDKKNLKYRPHLAQYLCRKWNEDFSDESDKASKLDMDFRLFVNKDYLAPARGPSHVRLGQFECK